MITRDMEETIRQIVREEIAADELRRIEQEKKRPQITISPGPVMEPMPRVILLAQDPRQGPHR